jgi:hypothetical protein
MNRTKKFLRCYQGFVVAALFFLGTGCSPQMLWFLNRGDDKTPAQYPLVTKDSKKEITIAVVVTANPALLSFPDFSGLDRDLATSLGQMFVEETMKDKKQVKVIDQTKIAQLKQKNGAKWDLQSRSEIAKELGADFLMEIDIAEFSLYSKETGREVCHGKATVNVKVYEASGDGSAKFPYGHTSQPPLSSANNTSPTHYKQFLVKYLAKEIMQKHVPHTAERDLPTQLR